MPKTVTPDVLDVLATAEVDGNAVVLPGQLDRPLYNRVAKVLTAAGGRWDRRAKATVFNEPAAPLLEAIVLTGEVADVRREFDAFYTPPDIAEDVVHRAIAGVVPEGWPTTRRHVLEPSAGGGALVRPLLAAGAHVTAVDVRREPWVDDIDPDDCVFSDQDFLTIATSPIFDAVVMNPPFSRQQDMRHVTHALEFVRPGGRLVAIMSPAWTYRSTGEAPAFRAMLDHLDHQWWELERGAFRSAGTDVITGILEVQR